MSNLQVRIISAVVALVGLLSVYHFFGNNGVILLSLVIVLIGAWEFSKICLRPLYKSRKITALYMGICSVLLPLFSFNAELTLPVFASSLCVFFTGSLWLSRERIKIHALQSLLALAATGFIYCTLFPSFAFRILLMDDGFKIFFMFLVAVFMGDIFAYTFGRLFGKHRLMPALSPKKTVEGAIGGTVGSLASTVGVMYLLNLSFPPLAIAAIAFCHQCCGPIR